MSSYGAPDGGASISRKQNPAGMFTLEMTISEDCLGDDEIIVELLSICECDFLFVVIALCIFFCSPFDAYNREIFFIMDPYMLASS
jgi:hypothetical protein